MSFPTVIGISDSHRGNQFKECLYFHFVPNRPHLKGSSACKRIPASSALLISVLSHAFPAVRIRLLNFTSASDLTFTDYDIYGSVMQMTSERYEKAITYSQFSHHCHGVFLLPRQLIAVTTSLGLKPSALVAVTSISAGLFFLFTLFPFLTGVKSKMHLSVGEWLAIVFSQNPMLPRHHARFLLFFCILIFAQTFTTIFKGHVVSHFLVQSRVPVDTVPELLQRIAERSFLFVDYHKDNPTRRLIQRQINSMDMKFNLDRNYISGGARTFQLMSRNPKTCTFMCLTTAMDLKYWNYKLDILADKNADNMVFLAYALSPTWTGRSKFDETLLFMRQYGFIYHLWKARDRSLVYAEHSIRSSRHPHIESTVYVSLAVIGAVVLSVAAFAIEILLSLAL